MLLSAAHKPLIPTLDNVAVRQSLEYSESQMSQKIADLKGKVVILDPQDKVVIRDPQDNIVILNPQAPHSNSQQCGASSIKV